MNKPTRAYDIKKLIRGIPKAQNGLNTGFNFSFNPGNQNTNPGIWQSTLPALGLGNLWGYQNTVDRIRESLDTPYTFQTPVQSTNPDIQNQNTQSQAVTEVDFVDPIGIQTQQPTLDFNLSSYETPDASQMTAQPIAQQRPITWYDLFENVGRTHSIPSALTSAGYGFGRMGRTRQYESPQQRRLDRTGSLLMGIGGIGRAALGIAGNIASGVALANRETQAMNQYHEDMRRAMVDRNTRYLKDGGKVDESLIMTGGFTTGLPTHSPIQPNVEVEAGEFIQHPDGTVQQVEGKTHAQGGEKMQLESFTQVVSDHREIGKDLAKILVRDFGLKVKSKNTYADAIEKYRKQIGLTSILEEQAKIVDRIKKQEDVEHEATRDINLSFLSSKMQETEKEREPLETQLSVFTDFIFQHQELGKEKDGAPKTVSLQDGGSVEQTETIIRTYANQVAGVPYEEVMAQFQQLTEEEQQEVLNNMIVEIEQVAVQGQRQGDPQTEELLQMYAQRMNVPYEQILQEFEKMTPQEQDQLLQQISQELNQQTSSPEQIIEMFAQATGQTPEAIMQELQQLPPDQQQQLLAEMEQSLSNQQNMQDGGIVPGDGNTMTPEDFRAYSSRYTWEPGYGYRELNPTRDRLKQLYDLYGIEYDPNIFGREWTRKELDEGFGRMQQTATQRFPEVVSHYMSTRSNTKQDLDFYIERGLLTEDFLKDKGVQFDNRGKVRLGIKEQNLGREVDDAIYAEIEKNAKEKGLEEDLRDYRRVGFQDNRSYYRAPEVHPTVFNSQEELDSFLREIGAETPVQEVDGVPVYYANKEGLYVAPIVREPGTPTATPTPATETQQITPLQPELNMPWFDFNSLPPLPMAISTGRMQSVSPVQLNIPQTSPEAQLVELQRQVSQAQRIASQSPDSLSRIMATNLQNNATQVANQAIAQVNAENAQKRLQEEQFNEGQIEAANRLNTQLAQKYSDDVMRSQAILQSQVVGWHNLANRTEAQRQQNIFNRNIAESIYPNVRLSQSGVISSPGETLEGVDFFRALASMQLPQAKGGGTIRQLLYDRMFKAQNKK